MGHGQNVWDKVKAYGTKSKCDGTKSKCNGTKSNRMGQSVIFKVFSCLIFYFYLFFINFDLLHSLKKNIYFNYTKFDLI